MCDIKLTSMQRVHELLRAGLMQNKGGEGSKEAVGGIAKFMEKKPPAKAKKGSAVNKSAK